MEEHEVPLDIYTHDLLGIEKSNWHRADQPKEGFSEPTPLSQKQKYITILLCVGFLYFVALGVWTIQRKVVPSNMAEVSSLVFIPSQISPREVNTESLPLWLVESHALFPLEVNTESFPFRLVESHAFFPLFFNFDTESYWNWRPAFSEIDKDLARKIDNREEICNSITPPSNWQELIHPERNYIVVHSCLGSSGYFVGW